MDVADLRTNNLNNDDVLFLEKVMIDIRSYVNTLNSTVEKRNVLLFPPLNNFRRFLVHQLVQQTFRDPNLATISIGTLYGRRTVVYPAHLNTVAPRNEIKPTSRRSYIPKSNSRVMSNAPDTKTRKSRKPDLQIYVPRGRRMLDDSAEMNRRDRGSEGTHYSKYGSDEENALDSKLGPTGDWNIDDDNSNTRENWDSEILNSSVTISGSSNCCGAVDSKDESVIVLDSSKDESVIVLDTSKDESVIVLDTSEDRDADNVIVLETPERRDIESEAVEEKERNEDEIPQSSLDTLCDSKNSCIEEVTDISPSINHTKDSSTSENSNERLERSRDSKTVSVKTIGSEANVMVEAPSSSTKATSSTPKKNVSMKASECDWEELFDDSGDFVDESLVDELMKTVGKVSIQRPTQDYSSYQTADERTSDGECIIEVHDFPADFKTDDLFTIFAPYRSDHGFQIVWVDDTHALAIFSSPYLADEVLNRELPCVKTRPLRNAIPKSRAKARNYVAAPVARPKTCVSLARRLVSGALGMKINITDKQREAERKLLSDAREKRRLIAKQKFDVWESAPNSGR